MILGSVSSPCYWFDGTKSAKGIKWAIARAVPQAIDFDFKAPSDLSYDSAVKAASVTPKSCVKGMGDSTITYSDNVNIGRCTVFAVVEEGDNYTAGVVEVGSFEITEKDTGKYISIAVPLIFVMISLFAVSMCKRP